MRFRTAMSMAAAVLVTFATSRAGASSLDAALQPDVRGALELLYRGEREESRKHLDAAIAARPNDPLARLARVHWMWWSLLEGRGIRTQFEARLAADADTLAWQADALSGASDLVWIHRFAAGEAACTRGRWDGVCGRGWAAFQHHRAGIARLRAVRDAHSDWIEPRASLGLFAYYAARLPRHLRLLGRLAGVRGDRRAGRADLETAAAAGGFMQVQAAFFLIEILRHGECDALAAFPLAIAMQTRYPQMVGFRTHLADVLLELERPDRALALLAADTSKDAEARVQTTIWRARIACESGRPDLAEQAISGLDAAQWSIVAWAPAWRAYYAGVAAAQAGDLEAAGLQFDRVRRAPDVAGIHDLARRTRERLHDLAAEARARRVVCWPGDVVADDESLRALPADLPWVGFARATQALRAGDARTAFSECEAARNELDAEDGLLPRVEARRLQALWWSGELEVASQAAARPKGGVTSGVALIAAADQRTGFRIMPEDRVGSGTRFRLKDLGFPACTLVWETGGATGRTALGVVDGWWTGEVALPTSRPLRYRFLLSDGLVLPDPACGDVEVESGAAWSLLPAEGDPVRLQTL